MSTATVLNVEELNLTAPAEKKMAELLNDVEDNIEGVRVYATPGGCSGISFGMTFTDQINDNDSIREFETFKVIVDEGTMAHLKGVEIDFTDEGNGEPSFVFNNLTPVSSSSGCGTCGSSSSNGGGCG